MSRVSAALSKEVFIRAENACEYCRISIADTYLGGEVDHIRSVKHNGRTELDNLALACQACNRSKGTDLGSIATSTGSLVRFFDPRKDAWSEHFRVNDDGTIDPRSEIGEVTITVFGFNHNERVLERKGLIEIGHYKI
jgi:hypothetical protein